jgi:hypothetical protein
VKDLPGAAQTGGLAIVGRAGVSPSLDVNTSLSTSLRLRGHVPNALRLTVWGGNSWRPAGDQATQLAVHPTAKTQVGTQLDADGYVPMMAANQYVFAGSRHLVAHRVVLASSHPLLRTAVREGSSARPTRISHHSGADIPVCPREYGQKGRQECLPHLTVCWRFTPCGEKCGMERGRLARSRECGRDTRAPCARKKNAPRGKGNPRGALRLGGFWQLNEWIAGLIPILALLII